MGSSFTPGPGPTASLRGEFRYGLELARLCADPVFIRPARRHDAPPAMLVPGFLAGDPSLTVLATWLRRRGSRVARAGIVVNMDCAEREVQRLEARLQRFAEETGRRVVVIGQSRGGALARVLAVRNPDVVARLVMLGAPVRGSLDVGSSVLNAVRSVARLGDMGVPRMFTSECGTGACCESYRADLVRQLPEEVRAVSVYSRSDAIVAWRSCLDPSAEHVEVRSSHTGMSVNASVYRVLGQILDEEAERWTG